MRTDLTVRTATGVEHDLAVLAPEGTTWAQVSAAIAEVADGTRPAWCGRRALAPDLVLGRAPLLTGALLSADRPAATRPADSRLEVVGGHDCGASVPLRHGLVIGRDPGCDLVLTDPHVSRRHAVVSVSADQVTINDLDSTAGLFLGSRRVRSAVLGGEHPVRIGADLLALTDIAPRQVAAPPPAIVLPPAPPTRSAVAGRGRVLAMALPIVPSAVLAWLTGSWEFLAFAALGPIGTVAAPGGRGRAGRTRTSRRHRRRAGRHYAADLALAQAAVAAGLHAELLDRRERHPHPAALLRAVDAGAVTARDDGQVVRVGLGAVASRLVTIDGTERRPAGVLPDAPVTVDLAAGPVGLAGPPAVCAGLARWLVGQFAARAPAGSRCVVVDVADVTEATQVADAAGGADARCWGWLRWLAPSSRVAIEIRSEFPRGSDLDRGSAVLVLARDPAQLPASCATTLVAVPEPVATLRVQRGGHAAIAVPDRVPVGWSESLARALARRDGSLQHGADRPAPGVPDSCRLAALLPVGTPADLRRRWARDDGSARTPIGQAADGPTVIDLDTDGPHVLVAGSTGAGKSELLQSLVTGLALEHAPDRISFLLVDYKGGAAFADCAELPHTVGLVTDLDAQLTRRVLRSLASEVRRRERLLAADGAADLRGYRPRPGLPVPARLVIVVDEFATLAEELPTFVAGLVGIARRGRSLGLHLVLATQRPAGVVSPEIRANCALRICLRVTSAAESVDVVDTADAATISPHTPGRGYLRRDGQTAEFQTARVSGPAQPGTDRVRVLPVAAADRLPAAPPGAGSELRSLVALARAAAAGSRPPHRPWLPPLPDEVPLDALPAPRLDRLPVGLLDHPDDQAQPALAVDLTTGGAIAVAGRSGSGRTAMLRTLATAAAGAAPPDRVHIHAIDAAGEGLAGLLALPQVGTVTTPADGFDLAAGLVARLLDAARPPGSAPRLLLVDGWEQLCAASDDYDGGRTAQGLLALARAGRSTATTVVLAGGRATLAAQVTAVAATRFVLALGEPADYLAAGVPSGALADDAPPGRAVRVGDGVEVQFAVSAVPSAVGAELGAGLGTAAAARPVRAAERLRPLPIAVHLGTLGPGRGVCLGIGGDRAEPIRVDLVGSGAWVLVAGPPRSGRTTVLHTVLAQARPGECVVAAPPRSPLRAIARSVGVAVLSEAGTAPLPARGVALVDDVDQLADTGVADQLDRWLADGVPGRAIVAAGRTEALALGYRGLVSRLRSACSGIALHPAPGDPPVFGVPVPAGRSARPPGRGALVPDPGWGLGVAPIPLQVPIAAAPVAR